MTDQPPPERDRPTLDELLPGWRASFPDLPQVKSANLAEIEAVLASLSPVSPERAEEAERVAAFKVGTIDLLLAMLPTVEPRIDWEKQLAQLTFFGVPVIVDERLPLNMILAVDRQGNLVRGFTVALDAAVPADGS